MIAYRLFESLDPSIAMAVLRSPLMPGSGYCLIWPRTAPAHTIGPCSQHVAVHTLAACSSRGRQSGKEPERRFARPKIKA